MSERRPPGATGAEAPPVVVKIGAECYVVEGRAADIVAFVVAAAGDLNGHPQWQLVFDAGAGEVKPSLRKSYPRVERPARA